VQERAGQATQIFKHRHARALVNARMTSGHTPRLHSEATFRVAAHEQRQWINGLLAVPVFIQEFKLYHGRLSMVSAVRPPKPVQALAPAPTCLRQMRSSARPAHPRAATLLPTTQWVQAEPSYLAQEY